MRKARRVAKRKIRGQIVRVQTTSATSVTWMMGRSSQMWSSHETQRAGQQVSVLLGSDMLDLLIEAILRKIENNLIGIS